MEQKSDSIGSSGLITFANGVASLATVSLGFKTPSMTVFQKKKKKFLMTNQATFWANLKYPKSQSLKVSSLQVTTVGCSDQQECDPSSVSHSLKEKSQDFFIQPRNKQTITAQNCFTLF